MGKRKKKSKSAKVVASNKRSDNMNLRVILLSLIAITLLIFYIIVKNNIGIISMPSFSNIFKSAENENLPNHQYTDTQLFGTPTTAPITTTEIVRKNPDGTSTTIVKSEKGKISPLIFQWENYLLINEYLIGEKVKETEFVFKTYNLETGESKELFRSSDEEVIQGSFGPAAIIGNRLYFTYTAYLSNNPVYFMDLPPTGSVSTLSREFNGVNDFIKAGNFYYVINAVGDSCAGFSKYAIFDTKTNYMMQPWLTSSRGCKFGEQLLGFDQSGNMLFSYREEDPQDIEKKYVGTYTNITRVYPWTPDQKEIIFDTTSMPKNVKLIFYSKSNNSIVMVGDRISVLNLQTRAINFITEIPKEEKDVLGTSLDITDQYGGKMPQSLDEQLSFLKLPSNYQVIHK